MLSKIFRGTSPGVIIFIGITSAALWICAFLDPQMPGSAVYEVSPMPLYGIIKFMIGPNPLAGVIFSFLVLSLMLFLLVNFNTTLFFINERTFLPAVVYLLFTALFPQNQGLNPVLPASVFLMLALSRIMDAYRKPGTAYNFFDAGILISTGSLFYANMIWFGLLVIIGIALLRTGDIREIAVSIIGLAAPYIITIALYYIIGKDLPGFFTDFKSNVFSETVKFNYGILMIIALIYSGLMMLISLGFLFSAMNSKKIKSRKTFFLLLWGFAISLALYFFLPSVSVEMIWITGIPASYFLVHYFIFSRKKLVNEIIFSGLFLLIILIQVFQII
jgi:hypothetical protein